MREVIRKEEDFYTEDWDPFLEYPSYHPASMEKAKEALFRQTHDRKTLSDLVRAYNQSIGNDSSALANVERLSQPKSYCVITGQQLGFMGGPSYTVLKAMTTLLLAKSTGAIPLFWLASEDHDLGEIDHADVLDERGNLKRYRLHFPRRRYFVEDLPLSEKNRETFIQFFHELDLGDHLISLLDHSYAKSMAKILAHLFRGTGLVFIEPWVLRPIAKDFFVREIQEHGQIQSLLQKALKSSEVGTSNLFYKEEGGERTKIDLSPSSVKDWIEKVQYSPERFSTNVLARPVLQNLLFPTLAYVAGPGEFRYHCLLKEYHHFHGIKMPWIYPRISATFIPSMADSILRSMGISPWDSIPKQMEGIPPSALHFLRQLFHPKGKRQERVVNWFWFQKHSKKNLIQEILGSLHWEERGHCYLWI